MTKIQNPILPGFHPDPSIVRDGNKYYLATSTFEWFPGVALHVSEDLMNWEPMGGILTSENLLNLRGVPNGAGVWAPNLSYDGEFFYLLYSEVHTTADGLEKDIDNYLIRSRKIEGPWEDRVYLNSGGFDGALFHDTDGKKWFVGMGWDGRKEDYKTWFEGIYIQEYDTKKKCLVGEKKTIFHGTSLGFTEGPHLYRIGDYYYLLTAEGGTRKEHAITAARSKTLTGPYEVHPDNPILTSEDVPDHPIQYAGHGDLFETEDGEWYLVHLGTRPSLFQGYSVMGRETFLEHIVWSKDGWPYLDTVEKRRAALEVAAPKIAEGKEQKRYPFYGTYTFSEQELKTYFCSLRQPQNPSWILTHPGGGMRLLGRESIFSKFYQSLIGLRISEAVFSARVEMEFSPQNHKQAAGLCCFYNTANFYYLKVTVNDTGEKILLLQKRQNHQIENLDEIKLQKDKKRVWLRVDQYYDNLHFLYSEEEKPIWWFSIGETCDARILSDEYATESCEEGYTGAFLALCAQDQSGARKEADFYQMQIRKTEFEEINKDE